MENPRTRIPGEWAPPPPIIISPTPAREPSRPPSIRPEEEFEATLGSLVEHFNTLPPPAFGEAPEIVAVPSVAGNERRRPHRSMALVWIGSLVLGATIAGGVMLGLNLARREATVAAPAAASQVGTALTNPQVKIVVKSLPEETEKSTQAVEPLAEGDDAAVAEHSASEDAKVAANPDRKPRKATVRKRARTRRAGPSGPQIPASADGWEDPYK